MHHEEGERERKQNRHRDAEMHGGWMIKGRLLLGGGSVRSANVCAGRVGVPQPCIGIGMAAGNPRKKIVSASKGAHPLQRAVRMATNISM